MGRVWAILQADTDAARAAAKAAGCTHAVINIHWNSAQPTATGSINATALANVKAAYANCAALKLKVILSINLQYPATWVLNGVEKFKDQAGFEYNDTNVGGGKAVRNWMWNQTGRTYVADFISRLGAGLTADERAQTWACRLGGGWFGELHYPEKITGSTAGTYAWQGFGNSMQTGTDLAPDLTVCPLPGYIPYGTGYTDANNATWLNWYLNGMVTWTEWLVAQYKAAGFTKRLYLLLPGYGIRRNQSYISGSLLPGYKQAAALGEDTERFMGAHMFDPQVQHWCTHLNTADGYVGGVVDSDKSAWKAIYEKSRVRNKHTHLLGENTGQESNSGMDGIFAGALGNSSYAGWIGASPAGYFFEGMIWLSYGDLNFGSPKATLAHYAEKIAELS